MRQDAGKRQCDEREDSIMDENKEKKEQPAGNPLLFPILLLFAIYVAVGYVMHTGTFPVTDSTPPQQQPAAQPVQQVQNEAPVQRSTQGTRSIYLTFDDGPCENTPRVLDILDRYGAKATFFTVGMYVDRYPETTADIVRRGNLIACHTYTHDYEKCYASADAFIAETEKWKRSVQKACGGLPPRLCVRFPGGSTTKYAADVRDDIIVRLNASGYRWFDWNAGDNDKWPKGNTKSLPDTEYFMQSYRECMGWFDETPDVPVEFLFHDTEEGSVDILPDVLQDLINRGYNFRLLDEHPDWG